MLNVILPYAIWFIFGFSVQCHFFLMPFYRMNSQLIAVLVKSILLNVILMILILANVISTYCHSAYKTV